MRWVASLAALSVLLPAVSAQALTYREQRALQVAQAKWKRLPCGGLVVMERRALDRFATARAVGPCTIAFDRARLSSLPWALFCTTVVHEIGHLLGIGHSIDRRSVMHRSPTIYWRCAS